MPLEHCPNCGAELPPRARVCPECGADEHAGWSAPDAAENLDLPDDEFDYDQFVQREFGRRQLKPRGVPWFWWVVAAVLAALFLAWSIRW
jgi:hypothetical protein